ncbi:hypothetical protein EWM62_17285 [Mucilaginibacter terrigena]|uniref:Uncharacterized protein n=1 Tax=Mucilaginibacter terrigena TaxID=2492395 RepID=A0A4Q5LHK2_9SPHI|nr:hypothetical protein [Mucilaginibacter terrigena]RYU86903.1 hypothetical protein EWM62_17285 [Mucilaginibacter terrigena]
MGIKQETVNLNFKWNKFSKTTKVFLISSFIFAFSLIRFSFSTEYIGYFAGECNGVCKVNYTITSNKLIIDNFNNDNGKNTHKVIKGDFDGLKFNAPFLLLSNITGRFGCPDCDDGGGYVMGYKFLWMHFSFEFDRDSSPWYFSGAVAIIKERLKKIDELAASRSNP